MGVLGSWVDARVAPVGLNLTPYTRSFLRRLEEHEECLKNQPSSANDRRTPRHATADISLEGRGREEGGGEGVSGGGGRGSNSSPKNRTPEREPGAYSQNIVAHANTMAPARPSSNMLPTPQRGTGSRSSLLIATTSSIAIQPSHCPVSDSASCLHVNTAPSLWSVEPGEVFVIWHGLADGKFGTLASTGAPNFRQGFTDLTRYFA